MAHFRPGQDLVMMQGSGEWPYWPLLPVKRPDPRFSNGGRGTSFKQFGLMVAVESRMLHVYLARMGEIHAAPGATVNDALDTVERLEYASYEAIVADGWIVG